MLNIQIDHVEGDITIIKPIKCTIEDLWGVQSLEGKVALYRWLNQETDEIELIAYCKESQPLKDYAETLQEKLFVFCVPELTGVFYLGGE